MIKLLIFMNDGSVMTIPHGDKAAECIPINADTIGWYSTATFKIEYRVRARITKPIGTVFIAEQVEREK